MMQNSIIARQIDCVLNGTMKVGLQKDPPDSIRTWTPSQNTLILLNKNLKIYESVVDKEVNIGQKAYDFPMVSQTAFEN